MTGAARHAVVERRLDGSVAKFRVKGLRLYFGFEAFPGREIAVVDLAPLLQVEARIGKLADSHGARRCSEFQRACVFPLPFVGIVGCGRRILKIAGRIAISGFAYGFEQFVIARAIIHAECLFQFLFGAARLPRRTALGIINDAPGAEAVGALARVQDAVPVQQHGQALLQDVGMKTPISGSGKEPDLAA